MVSVLKNYIEPIQSGDFVAPASSGYAPPFLGFLATANELDVLIPLNRQIVATSVTVQKLTISIYVNGTRVVNSVDITQDSNYTITSKIEPNVGVMMQIVNNTITFGTARQSALITIRTIDSGFLFS